MPLGYAGTQAIGVWGDTSNGTGVFGSSDIGSAIVGISTSEQATAATFENDESVTGNSQVLVTIGRAFNGSCDIDVSGNLFCTGTKSAVVPVDGGARKVALYAVESPENWFEDAGSSQLSNGSAVISLESIFAQTVNAEMDYHVFLTPKGDCEGLYVSPLPVAVVTPVMVPVPGKVCPVTKLTLPVWSILNVVPLTASVESVPLGNNVSVSRTSLLPFTSTN